MEALNEIDIWWSKVGESPSQEKKLSKDFLKEILAQYLQIKPEEVEFLYQPGGKPYTKGLHFSLTHSHGLVICAVSRHQEVGVDVEKIREEVDVLRIAKRFFNNQQNQMIEKEPDISKTKLFFSLWTKNEAIMKASGKGFGLPMSQIRSEDWCVKEIQPAKGFIGAVAAGGDFQVVIQGEV